MRRIPIFFLAWIFAIVATHAQETIDTAQFWAVYTFSYKTHPELVRFDERDRMLLDMGDRLTKFYSHYTQMRDSIASEGFKNKLSLADIQDKRRGIPWGTESVYYQWYSKKKTQVSTVFLHNGYTYEEPMTMPEWILHEDTMTVLGYVCKRATTHYRGRDWEVYYTSDIPLSRGPWKLWGLPGLIVHATDADGYFLFEMTNFERIPESVVRPILYIHRKEGSKGDYKGAEYKKVSKKTYIQYEKAYHEDVNAFREFEFGHKVFTPDGSPLPITKTDYIPLEK
jgi:hypothetical protein